jgi:hypothetical protein
MAKACAGCGYRASADEIACPTCNRLLQFTLLPPRNAPAERDRLPPQLSHGPASGNMYRGQGSLDFIDFALKNRALMGIFLAPIALLGLWFFGFGRESARAKFDAIQIGMSQEQVEKILFESSGSGRRRRPNRSVRQLRDDGEAVIQWSSGPMTITVNFQNGRVVHKSQTGLDEES